MTSEAATDYHNVARSNNGDSNTGNAISEKANSNDVVVTTPLLPKTNNTNAK